MADRYDNFILVAGDGDFGHLIKGLRQIGKKVIVVSGRKSMSGTLVEEANKFVTMERIIEHIPWIVISKGGASTKKNPAVKRVLNKGTYSIASLFKVSSNIMGLTAMPDEGSWVKVKEVDEGDLIMVAPSSSRVIWDEIIKIEKLPAEKVYDIEVEGTHNFVGNDIVAHNTYLGGGLGVGVQNSTNGTILTSGKVGVASSTPCGLLSVNPSALGSGVPEFVIGSSTATHFIVNGAGNVGIGTASPSSSYKFH